MLSRVKDVSGALEDHITEVEGPGGLADDITVHVPRLIGMMNVLKAEHVELRQMVAQLFEDLGRSAGKFGNDKVVAVRRKALVFLGRIARHRQKGADLVYEAYNVDIGGE